MRRALSGVVAIVASFALLVACTGKTTRATFQPSYHEHACPEDLDFALVERHTAGLTVLEDRSKPDGRTIKLFVVHVVPQSGTAGNPDSIFVPGTRLATVQGFFGVAAAPIGQTAKNSSWNSVGSGDLNRSWRAPSRVNPVTIAAATGDPSARQAFADAVGARVTSGSHRKGSTWVRTTSGRWPPTAKTSARRSASTRRGIISFGEQLSLGAGDGSRVSRAHPRGGS